MAGTNPNQPRATGGKFVRRADSAGSDGNADSGDSGSGSDAVSPADAFGAEPGFAATGAEQPVKRRGGWPKGRLRGSPRSGGGSATRAPAGKAATELAVSTLQGTLNEIHGFLGALTGLQSLPDEATTAMLAQRMHTVQQHFPMPGVDPKWLAVGMLIVGLGKAYKPAVTELLGKSPQKPAQPRNAAAPPMPQAETVSRAQPVQNPVEAAIERAADAGSWFNLNGGKLN